MARLPHSCSRDGEQEGSDLMAGLILEAKLRIPQLRSNSVARTGLIERLRQGIELPLILVSAPAGFGKTTLLTQWLATGDSTGRTTGWVSLDSRDNDPAAFWRYLSSAGSGLSREVVLGQLRRQHHRAIEHPWQ